MTARTHLSRELEQTVQTLRQSAVQMFSRMIAGTSPKAQTR